MAHYGCGANAGCPALQHESMSKEFWATVAALIGVFIAIVSLMIALIADVRGDMNAMRAELNAAHESIRADMSVGHESIRTDMNAAHESIRTDMNAAHDLIYDELREIRNDQQELNARVGRIEGHLFGVVLPDPSEPALDSE